MSLAGGLRILGGTLRGRRLTVPAGARPSAARLREALFSIWQERVRGARFLDLFAGSGAVGLEALSRGARSVVFVDDAHPSLVALRRNLEALAPGAGQVLRHRLPDSLPQLRDFDLMFADPPYAFGDFAALLRASQPWLAPGGVFALEHSSRNVPGERHGPWRREDFRTYGESCLSFYQVE